MNFCIHVCKNQSNFIAPHIFSWQSVVQNTPMSIHICAHKLKKFIYNLNDVD
jgi:hypothetical protein